MSEKASPRKLEVHGSHGTTHVLWSCPHADGIKEFVLFFEGDQVDEESSLMLGELVEPAHHLELLQHRFTDCCIAIISPSRLEGGFACYDNLLEACTLTGEPMGYQGSNLKASSHVALVLQTLLADMTSVSEPNASSPHLMVPSPLRLRVCAFSKGCVVLNQLLAEMAVLQDARSGSTHPAVQANLSESTGEEAGSRGDASPKVRAADGLVPVADVAGRLSRAPEKTAARVVLDSIHAVDFVDAGLNCKGVHLTDPRLIDGVGARCHAGLPLHVSLHGTPRQWDNHRRVWIVQEKDRAAELMRMAGISVEEQLYMKGSPASLRQHFLAIPAFCGRPVDVRPSSRASSGSGTGPLKL